MSDPYEVLGLSRDCDDTQIRRRYLELVRRYPPEREPERFAAIRAAYDQLRDPVTRMQSWLFTDDPPETLEAILAELCQRVRSSRIPTNTLLSLAEQR